MQPQRLLFGDRAKERWLMRTQKQQQPQQLQPMQGASFRTELHSAPSVPEVSAVAPVRGGPRQPGPTSKDGMHLHVRNRRA